jgi:hypothetical protein
MNRSRSCACAALCAACIAFLSLPAMGGTGRPTGQAVQFGIGNDFTLTDFGGTTLSYQRFVGSDVAWRVSLGINLRYDNVDHSEEYTADDVAEDSVDQVEWSHRLSVASEWLWYRGNTVSVFFGGGPRASFSSNQDEDSDYNGPADRWTRYRTSGDEFGVGLQGCIGVQWAATSWLAVHAQYGMRCEYLHRVQRHSWTITGEDGHFEEVTDTVDEVSFAPSGVRFGLSAYF